MNTPTNQANPMNNEISDLINQAVSNILINSSSENKLKNLIKKHELKIHLYQEITVFLVVYYKV